MTTMQPPDPLTATPSEMLRDASDRIARALDLAKAGELCDVAGMEDGIAELILWAARQGETAGLWRTLAVRAGDADFAYRSYEALYGQPHPYAAGSPRP